jgi:thioesterase domain-containing protein
VAFEIARLLARDRPVTTVLLVHPSPIESRLLAIDRLVRAVGRLKGHDHSAHTRTMIRVVTALQFLRQARASEVRDWAWRKIVRTVRRPAPRPAAVAPAARTTRHDPAMWQAVVHAVVAYVPRAYEGAVSLFVPPSAGTPTDRGWSRFARQLAIVPVPGDHRSCVTTHADALGDALETQLRGSASDVPCGERIEMLARKARRRRSIRQRTPEQVG